MLYPRSHGLILLKLVLVLSVVGSSAEAEDQTLDRFAETLAQRCLFENPTGYEAVDHPIQLPFFQRGVRAGAVQETIFGEYGSWAVVTVIAPNSARLACSFSVHLPLQDVRTTIAQIDGVATGVVPWMDPLDGQNILALIEGDGMREPAFFAIVGLTSGSEGNASLTLGTISFLPMWMLYQ